MWTRHAVLTEAMKDGWLRAPDQREVRRYHRDPDCNWRRPWVFIDYGLPIEGQPALLRRRRRVPRDAALIEWKGLQKAGWRRVKPQW